MAEIKPFDLPGNGPITDESGAFAPVWGAWLSLIHRAVATLRESGPTALRPGFGLWIGRRYWDTDLQKPVYVASVNPTVWKDSSGAPV